jgi:hypothetical protein
MSSNKTYTEEEVQKLVKTTLSAATEGFLEWLKLETDVVDIDSREVLDNAEITMKGGNPKKISEYIYPRLREHGIDFVK